MEEQDRIEIRLMLEVAVVLAVILVLGVMVPMKIHLTQLLEVAAVAAAD
jgi:hypothetical protein